MLTVKLTNCVVELTGGIQVGCIFTGPRYSVDWTGTPSREASGTQKTRPGELCGNNVDLGPSHAGWHV